MRVDGDVGDSAAHDGGTDGAGLEAFELGLGGGLGEGRGERENREQWGKEAELHKRGSRDAPAADGKTNRLEGTMMRRVRRVPG